MSRFIVIDGLDGSGKSTQMDLLRESFKHHPVVFTREPGGTPYAEDVRKVLLGSYEKQSPALADLLLFFGARADHIAHVILPALVNFQHIVSDRYDSSSYAFQLFGAQQYEELGGVFHFLRDRVVEYAGDLAIPATYIFLDLPAAEAHARCKKAAKEKQSKFDVQPVEYHERVREGFRRFADEYGDKSEMIFLDANTTPFRLKKKIVREIERIFAADDDNREK